MNKKEKELIREYEKEIESLKGLEKKLRGTKLDLFLTQLEKEEMILLVESRIRDAYEDIDEFEYKEVRERIYKEIDELEYEEMMEKEND